MSICPHCGKEPERSGDYDSRWTDCEIAIIRERRMSDRDLTDVELQTAGRIIGKFKAEFASVFENVPDPVQRGTLHPNSNLRQIGGDSIIFPAARDQI